MSGTESLIQAQGACPLPQHPRAKRRAFQHIECPEQAVRIRKIDLRFRTAGGQQAEVDRVIGERACNGGRPPAPIRWPCDIEQRGFDCGAELPKANDVTAIVIQGDKSTDGSIEPLMSGMRPLSQIKAPFTVTQSCLHPGEREGPMLNPSLSQFGNGQVLD